MKRDLNKPLASTFGDDPKKKKYTAKDSSGYQNMVKRQVSDFDKLGNEIASGRENSKAALGLKNRIGLRADSISNSPYGKKPKKK